MFASGIFIALGLSFIWFKLDWKWRIWMNSNPIKIDLLIFVALTLLHWGTYSGVMAATIGAMACSAMLGLSAKAVGRYVGSGSNRTFKRGWMNIKGVTPA